MSDEKVLGFLKKDAVAGIWRDMDLDKRLVYLKMETGELRKVWLIPVRLVSESVSLRWLEKWCKKKCQGYCHSDMFGFESCKDAVAIGNKPHISEYVKVKDLLLAVKQESEKK